MNQNIQRHSMLAATALTAVLSSPALAKQASGACQSNVASGAMFR